MPYAPGMVLDAGMLALGLVLLYFGAEWLVKGAAGLGRALGIRPLVIGLTVVAYGTSMPELVVSTVASLDGRGAIALGNVVGSNIANLALILGTTALVAPIPVEGMLIKRELPVLFATALLVPALLFDGWSSRLDAVLLLVGAAGFTLLTARAGLTGVEGTAAVVEADAERTGAPHARGKGALVGIGLVGLALLVGGGKLFVDGASAVALGLGMSERVVGLTIVAIGTSLPELAASIVAALRGHAAIAVGNVIGSNIFNVLFVLGGTGTIEPIPGSVNAIRVDLGAMMVITVVALWLLRKERKVSRVEGAVLAGGYLGFLVVLALV